MRIVIIVLLTSFILLSCSGCSDTTRATDGDDIHDSYDEDVIEKKDAETEEEAVDILVDEDDEISDLDNDSDVGCLDLRNNDNVIKTPFPFKDKDGKPTFCRPGCDTPTETDPQCVRNIWDWINWESYQGYLAAEKKDPDQYTERECYPWPCKMPDMKGSTESPTSSCDRFLTINNFSADGGGVWTHGMSGGVAGMELTHNGEMEISTARAMEYNPTKDEFTTVGQASGRLSFSNDRYVLLVFDRNFMEHGTYRSFVVSVLRKDGKYYYELIYDAKEHQASFSRPSFSGKEWVLIQVCEGRDGACEVKYAKVGVWEWHSLGVGAIYEGNIVGNHLTMMVPYTNPDRQIYYCDLSTYPKSYKECLKVTRNIEGVQEVGHSPRIDENDEKRMVYYLWQSDPLTLVEVTFDEVNTPTYQTHTVDYYMETSKLKGNYLMHDVIIGDHIKSCWYRFDLHKSYCPQKPWDPYTGGSDFMFGIFSGKWQLWKTKTSTVIRDWECYCAEEGICPFEGSEPPKMDD